MPANAAAAAADADDEVRGTVNAVFHVQFFA